MSTPKLVSVTSDWTSARCRAEAMGTRRVFLDCGTNLGQGLTRVYETLNMDKTWEVYCFEVNQNCNQYIRECEIFKNHPNITLINKGVWIADQTRLLTENFCPHTTSHYDDGDWVGGGSNIIEDAYLKPDYVEDKHLKLKSRPVACIDFSAFVRDNITPDDYLVVKMDIEGAEYEVLDKMIKDETLQLINELVVEFHSYDSATGLDLYDSLNRIQAAAAEHKIKITCWN